jgi:phosphoglycerate kinase
MLYNLKNIKDAAVQNQTILLRADLDVPVTQKSEIGDQILRPRAQDLGGSGIEDDSRLNSWFPTLQYLLENGAKVIIVGHLGRPKGIDEEFTLKPVADWIAAKLQAQTLDEKIGEFKAWKLTEKVSVLENIRFYEEEEKNDSAFAQKLASTAQIFVNDAFATAHRAHASTEGVTHFLPSFAGLRVQKEVEVLSKVLENPERPLGVVIGGAKIETKLPLVEKMHNFADCVCVGGTIMGNEAIVAEVSAKPTERNCVLITAEPVESKLDATLESVEKFVQALQSMKTIVWNGPLGKIEDENYQQGTLALAQGITSTSAYTVLGGGDTIAFLKTKGLLDKFSFASVGGGAMLEFLAGVRLPGLVALEA